MALVGAVAVAQARNISGGVNPSATLPGARNRFGSRGPLSRLLGGHFHNLDCTLQRACYNRLFTTVNNTSLEGHSFLERVLRHVGDTWPASNAVLSGIVLDVREKRKIITTDLNAIIRSLRNLLRYRVGQDY